jgi:hypothetical protein
MNFIFKRYFPFLDVTFDNDDDYSLLLLFFKVMLDKSYNEGKGMTDELTQKVTLHKVEHVAT